MNLIPALLTLCAISLVGCATQSTPEPPKTTTRSIPGGWNEAKIDDGAQQALDVVLQQMNTSAKLDKILAVRKQVVAGMNYDIDFQLDNGEHWNTRVFRDLKGNYTMTKAATLIK